MWWTKLSPALIDGGTSESRAIITAAASTNNEPASATCSDASAAAARGSECSASSTAHYVTPSSLMQIGDRVKLTAQAARGLSSRYQQRKMRATQKVNWAARRGVVIRVTNQHVTIQWDGLKSFTSYPPSIIELDVHEPS